MEATVTVRPLADLEATIERGLTTFVEVGQALLEIREHRLYRETHDSFEVYCRERWGWSRQRAHQMIEASSVSTMVDTDSLNERQARELAPLRADPEAVREVWAEVQESTNGRPTAATIREAVDRRLPTRHVPEPDFEAYPFTCDDCGDGFQVEVWHCPTCAHHWSVTGDDLCKNCLSAGEYTYRPGVMAGGYMEEQALHQRFAHLRIADEWFTPSTELCNFIRQNSARWSVE